MRQTATWLTLLCAGLAPACNGHDQGPRTGNTSLGRWTVADSMPSPRSDNGVATLNGKLYSVGGYYRVDVLATVDVYDPGTNTWSRKAPLPTARAGLGVGVVNGVLYAVGGFVPYVGSVGAVEAYDPATDTWTTKAPMLTPRDYLAVGILNGVLYAVGGYVHPGGAQMQSDSVEAYDPVSNTWTSKASMTIPRSMLGVAVVNGILYAVGGTSQNVEVEAYNPTTNTWTTKASMPTKRSGLGVGVVNGLIYAVGGVPIPGDTQGFLNTVEAYDPSTNIWTTKAKMPTPRTEFAVGVLGNTLYAVGGIAPIDTNSYGFTANNEAYQP